MSVTTHSPLPSSVCSACRSAIAIAVGLCLRCYARLALSERGEEAREEVSADADD